MKCIKRILAKALCVLIIVTMSTVFNLGNVISLGSEATSGFSYLIRNSNSESNSQTLYLVLMSMNELIQESELIVYGRVKYAETIDDTLTTNGGIGSIGGKHSEYYIEPISILRGEPVNKREIIVRKAGGATEILSFACGAIYPLNVGDEYLLFLDAPQEIGRFETSDIHYNIQCGNQGVYEPYGKKSVTDAFGNTVPAEFYSGDDESPVVKLDFKIFEAKIMKANIDTPVEPFLYSETVLESWKANLSRASL